MLNLLISSSVKPDKERSFEDDLVDDKTLGLLDGEKKKTWANRICPNKPYRELILGLTAAALILAGLITVMTLSLTLNVKKEQILILVSIDGFRFKYLNNTDHPNISNLLKSGVHSQLTPVFPSITFPNHYSAVTGLNAESHGIVGNVFYDPDLNKTFSYKNSNDASNPEWWIGKPIWHYLKSNNIKSASCFWPGSEVVGQQPTYFEPYDGSLSHEERINKVLGWLDLPFNERPPFIMTYFSDVDSQGHSFGPDSDEVKAAIKSVDKAIGQLISGIGQRSRRFEVDIIIISDHGMTKLTDPIFLDDFIDIQKYRIPELSVRCPHASIWAPYEEIPDLLEQLKDLPNAKVYRKEFLPDRFNIRNSNRTAPLHIVADLGYSLTTHEYYTNFPRAFLGGDHGYDPLNDDMKGIFIGSGASFVQNNQTAPMAMTEVFNLISAIMNISPPPNNGTYPFIEGVLDPKKYKIPEPPAPPVTPATPTTPTTPTAPATQQLNL